MHRNYADRINSRSMYRVFCDLRSQKTPHGILPVNSNFSLKSIDRDEYKEYNHDRKNKSGQNDLEVITWRLQNRKMK